MSKWKISSFNQHLPDRPFSYFSLAVLTARKNNYLLAQTAKTIKQQNLSLVNDWQNISLNTWKTELYVL